MRYRSRIQPPPDDVVDTKKELDAYYRDMEDALEEMEPPDPSEYE